MARSFDVVIIGDLRVPGRHLDLDRGRDRGPGAGRLPHGRAGAQSAGAQIPASDPSADSCRVRDRAGPRCSTRTAVLEAGPRAAPPPAGDDQPAGLAASRARRASPAGRASPAVRFRRQAVLRVAAASIRTRRHSSARPCHGRRSVRWCAISWLGLELATTAVGDRTGTMCSTRPPGRSTRDCRAQAAPRRRPAQPPDLLKWPATREEALAVYPPGTSSRSGSWAPTRSSPASWRPYRPTGSCFPFGAMEVPRVPGQPRRLRLLPPSALGRGVRANRDRGHGLRAASAAAAAFRAAVRRRGPLRRADGGGRSCFVNGWTSRQRVDEQAERGRAAVADRFSHERHVERVRELIGPPPARPRPRRTRSRVVLFFTSNGVGSRPCHPRAGDRQALRAGDRAGLRDAVAGGEPDRGVWATRSSICRSMPISAPT